MLLESPRVQMVLLVDGRRFRGAITELPNGADPDAAALPFAERKPETLSPATRPKPHTRERPGTRTGGSSSSTKTRP